MEADSNSIEMPRTAWSPVSAVSAVSAVSTAEVRIVEAVAVRRAGRICMLVLLALWTARFWSTRTKDGRVGRMDTVAFIIK